MNKLNLPGVKINEKQNCIEKTITFKQLKNYEKLFNKLPFQIDLDEEKIQEMKVAYLKNPDYLIYKNKIVIAVVCNKFSEEYKLYIVDGQHRIEMAKILFEKENINDYLTICYYKIKSDKSMKELFKEINSDSYKNNKYISLNDFTESLYDSLREYLKSKYSIFFSEKKSTINRRYSLTEFLDILISNGVEILINNKNDYGSKNKGAGDIDLQESSARI